MSKVHKAKLLTAAGVIALVAAGQVRGETLGDAVALAYQANPTVLTQRATLRLADEAYYRNGRTFGPAVEASVTVTGGTDNDLINGGGGSSSAGVGVGINLAQPIYTGGRLTAQQSSQQASLLSQRENLRRVESDVVQRTVEAYVGVLRAQESLRIVMNSLDFQRNAQREANVRFDLKVATRTDVAQADTRFAQAQTDVSTAQSQLAAARAQYAGVVGQNPGELAEPPSLASLMPSGVEQAFEVAQRNNAALRAAYLAERSSAAGISSAQSAYRPQVSVTAGAQYQNSNSAFPGVGFRDSAGLTTGLRISIPLFTGFTTASAVRSAKEANNIDKIAIEAQRRALLQQVTVAWNQYTAAQNSILSSEQAVRAARLVTEGARLELELGVRTQLENLNAEQELRRTEQGLVNAKFNAYVASITLLNAMGVLEARVFAPDVAPYDPIENFNKVNGFSLPWEDAVKTLDQIGAAPIPGREPGTGEIVPLFTAP